MNIQNIILIVLFVVINAISLGVLIVSIVNEIKKDNEKKILNQISRFIIYLNIVLIQVILFLIYFNTQ